MNPRDIVELAFQRFRTRSLRFLLTVLGVGVGIGVVFFLVSLGFGLQEVVIGRIATSESLLALTVAVSDEAESLVTITDETLAAFREIEQVEDVSPLLSVPSELTHQTLKAQSLTQAVAPSYFRYAGVEATQGKLFGEDEPESIVVSTTTFRLFGWTQEEAIGKEIFLTFFLPRTEGSAAVVAPSPVPPGESGATSEVISGDVNVISIPRPFRIVGAIDSDINNIFVPLSVFNNIPKATYTQVKVRVTSQESIGEVRGKLVSLGYSVTALTDTLDQLNRIFRVTQATLAALGVIALFIASVGMFNTLTISLLERTQEVGILKAIGATNLDVWKIFLFEAFLIGLLGGLAGLLGGFAFAQLVNWLVNILAARFGGGSVKLFVMPWWFILSILGISLSVGIFTGLYPARRAAHLNPLRALRRE